MIGTGDTAAQHDSDTRGPLDAADATGAVVEDLLAAIRSTVAHRIAERRGDPRQEALRQQSDEQLARLEEHEAAPGPLRALRGRLGLSLFETRALLLAAAARLDHGIAELAGTFHESGRRTWPSPWLAWTCFGEGLPRAAVLAAFEPDGPLRRSGAARLEAREPGQSPLARELVAAGFVVDALLERPPMCADLEGAGGLRPPGPSLDAAALPRGDRDLLATAAERLAGALASPPPIGGRAAPGLLAALSGPPGSGRTLAAHAMATHAGRPILEVRGPSLYRAGPARAAELVEIAAAEAAFHGAWLLLDDGDRALAEPRTPGAPPSPAPAADALTEALERLPVVTIVTARDVGALPADLRGRLAFAHDLHMPDRAARAQLWKAQVPAASAEAVEALADAYALTGRGIANAVRLASGPTVPDATTLTACAAVQQQPDFGANASRQGLRRTMDDLILPDETRAPVEEIIATERVRTEVLRRTGLGARLGRGLGLACLFDGPPGTGKTLAAEVIACELGLPLYAVNVANVVSKWIGETEKNLEAIFGTAERYRCVLLFDEADALFARRTEVSGANERHANLEVALLLQLVERHPGLVVLTTNLKENIDPAFARRFAFHVHFETPDAPLRELTWRRLLPAGHLSADVDMEWLAQRFELGGGNIRNVVLRAAYRAAIAGAAIGMNHLEDAAVAECRALGKVVRFTD